MLNLSELTPKALRESVTAVDRLYSLLKKVAVDGWRGMSVLRKARDDSNELEAVDHLITSLRTLHAFRLTAVTQIEKLARW